MENPVVPGAMMYRIYAPGPLYSSIGHWIISCRSCHQGNAHMTLTRLITSLAAAIVLLCALAAPAQADQGTRTELNIPAQPLRDALAALGRQTGLQVVYTAEEVAENLTAPRLIGAFSADDALARLLSNTELRYEYLDERTIAIRTKAAGAGPAGTASISQQRSESKGLRVVQVAPQQTAANSATETKAPAASVGDAGAENTKGIPEILVKGARSGNTDIRRTEDDVQPYVVFDAEEISRSMAPDLETFLKTRLPMNQSRASNSQSLSSFSMGNQSTIDLRGLGADQTLILVNGRRMPGVATDADTVQPDISGIPISAVERIEILPSTAGGIYGGGATGGVLNIILKRNYNDLELSARYDGTFAGGGAERRLDATGGFTLEGGRTRVMVMASYRDGNPLYLGDREFTVRSRRLQEQNNRAAFAASEPVYGYTTNVRSVSGNDLELLDGGSLNSPIAHVPVGYAGPASDNGAAFLGTAGHYNLDLPNDSRGKQYSLVFSPTVRSLALNLRREFTDRIETFVEVSRYDRRSLRMGSSLALSDANLILPVGANNPFTEAVRLSIPQPGYDGSRLRTHSDSLTEQVGGGLIVRLPRQWTVQPEYSWSRSNTTSDWPADLFTADGAAALIDGRLNPLSDVNAYPLDFSGYIPGGAGQRDFRGAEWPSEQKNATLRIAGPLLNLAGGPLRLAALLERREQYTGDRLQTTFTQATTTPTYTYYPEIGSTTESVYTELTAPLVSAANAQRGLLGLDLQASYRHDATRTGTNPYGSQVTVPSADGPFPDGPMQFNEVTGHQYTLGVRYTPMDSLALRVSYGEGILPPSPIQLSEGDLPPFILAFAGYRDPKRNGELITGATVEKSSIAGSLALRPEHSQSWSAGAILTPARLPGLRLSLDYTRIEKIDEIGFLNTQVLIDLADSFPGAIVRNPLTPADEALGYTGGTIRELNTGFVNIAHSLMEAVDIQADYTWQTHLGDFAAHVIATVQPRLAQQPAPDTQELNTVGYSNGPLKWRANAGLRWSRGPLELGWNLQYYDASRVYTITASTASRDAAILDQGSALIPTQTYHDVYGRYRFDSAPGFARGLLQNTELQVSVQNVLNTSPPILASATTLAAGYATEGDARLRRYSIAFTKRFGR